MADDSAMVITQTRDNAVILTIQPTKLRDLLVVQTLKDQMLAEVARSKAIKVLLDMRNVEMVGSVAFLAFLGIRRQPNVERVILCHLSPPVLELFHLCKLIATDNHTAGPFEYAATIEDAFAA